MKPAQEEKRRVSHGSHTTPSPSHQTRLDLIVRAGNRSFSFTIAFYNPSRVIIIHRRMTKMLVPLGRLSMRVPLRIPFQVTRLLLRLQMSVPQIPSRSIKIIRTVSVAFTRNQRKVAPNLRLSERTTRYAVYVDQQRCMQLRVYA